MYTKVAVLFIYFISCNFAYADCLYNKSKKSYFSNNLKPDNFVAEVSGITCTKAIVSLKIINSNGVELYVAKDKLYDLNEEEILVYEDLGHKNITAEKIITRNIPEDLEFRLRDKAFNYSNELPKWLPHKAYNQKHHVHVYVSESYYNKLLGMKWHTFSHPVGYEDHVLIVYDEDNRKIVTILGSAPNK